MATLEHGTTIDGALIEKTGTATATGTTITVDLATGNYFEIDFQVPGGMTGNVNTFTINNPHTSQVSSFKINIRQDDPNRQITWGSLSAFKWPGGTGPTLSTGAVSSFFQDRHDILQFTTWDAATTWYGRVIGLRYD